MNEYLKLFKSVLDQEALAISMAMGKLNIEQIEKLIQIYKDLLENNSKLIICGVGKSGLIGRKISSTFSSLGLNSLYLHPTEALHGDLGNVRADDAIIFISNSGTTEEILKLLPFLSIPSIRRIGLLGNTSSAIAKKCDLIIDCHVEKEACLNNQAPTTSSTLSLAMGDAMAVVFEKYKGLTTNDFAINHPGGILGKSLRLKVKDLMISKNDCPVVLPNTLFKDALLQMTAKPMGMCAIVEDQNLKGIFVEGDVRRQLNLGKDVRTLIVDEVMNTKPIIIHENEMALKAFETMEKRKSPISVLPVINDNNHFVGMIRLHDLLKEGFK